jgi:hypothetical protein
MTTTARGKTGRNFERIRISGLVVAKRGEYENVIALCTAFWGLFRVKTESQYPHPSSKKTEGGISSVKREERAEKRLFFPQ